MKNLLKGLVNLGIQLGENTIKNKITEAVKNTKNSKVISLDGYKLQIINKKLYVVEVKKVFKNKKINEVDLNQMTNEQLIKLHKKIA